MLGKVGKVVGFAQRDSGEASRSRKRTRIAESAATRSTL